MFFFFNDTATTEIYTLSLHDALPISGLECEFSHRRLGPDPDHHLKSARLGHSNVNYLHVGQRFMGHHSIDRKSTRLNSSHANISYAVFCLKKKKIEYNKS